MKPTARSALVPEQILPRRPAGAFSDMPSNPADLRKRPLRCCCTTHAQRAPSMPEVPTVMMRSSRPPLVATIVQISPATTKQPNVPPSNGKVESTPHMYGPVAFPSAVCPAIPLKVCFRHRPMRPRCRSVHASRRPRPRIRHHTPTGCTRCPYLRHSTVRPVCILT